MIRGSLFKFCVFLYNTIPLKEQCQSPGGEQKHVPFLGSNSAYSVKKGLEAKMTSQQEMKPIASFGSLQLKGKMTKTVREKTSYELEGLI